MPVLRVKWMMNLLLKTHFELLCNLICSRRRRCCRRRIIIIGCIFRCARFPFFHWDRSAIVSTLSNIRLVSAVRTIFQFSPQLTRSFELFPLCSTVSFMSERNKEEKNELIFRILSTNKYRKRMQLLLLNVN